MKYHKHFTDNHMQVLNAVGLLINATAQAIAYGQNMPKSRDYWKRYLNDLDSEGLLSSKRIYGTARAGKVGRNLGTFYALTREGAALIAETKEIKPESVFYPKNGIYASSPHQYPHRAEFIELLAQFLGYEKRSEGRFEILDLVPYFRHDGTNRLGAGYAASRVQVEGDFKSDILIPDALIRFRAGDTVRLAAIEYHRETDAKGIIEQLRKHAAAIDKDAFASKYAHPAANHVLSVHADADKLRRVRERIEAGEFPDFASYVEGYHFATLDNIVSMGLENAFYTLKREKSKIF